MLRGWVSLGALVLSLFAALAAFFDGFGKRFRSAALVSRDDGVPSRPTRRPERVRTPASLCVDWGVGGFAWTYCDDELAYTRFSLARVSLTGELVCEYAGS